MWKLLSSRTNNKKQYKLSVQQFTSYLTWGGKSTVDSCLWSRLSINTWREIFSILTVNLLVAVVRILGLHVMKPHTVPHLVQWLYNSYIIVSLELTVHVSPYASNSTECVQWTLWSPQPTYFSAHQIHFTDSGGQAKHWQVNTNEVWRYSQSVCLWFMKS